MNKKTLLGLLAVAGLVASLTFNTGCAGTGGGGISTNAVVSVITDPTTIQDIARTGTIVYLTQTKSAPAREDIAAVTVALTSLINSGTLDPVSLQTALTAAGVGSANTALYASLVTGIVDQYTKYAGSASVAGAVNQNAQLKAALSAALSGVTQGLAMTAPAARRVQ